MFGTELEPYAVSYRLRAMPPHELEKIGVGRGRRYKLAQAGKSDARVSTANAAVDAAEEIRAQIRQPREQRSYVTYDRDWLFDYVAGETFYLPAAIRKQLAEIGRSPGDTRPAGTFARDIIERLLIDLSWASSRLEGNTYSRLDTQLLLEFGQQAEGKDAREAQMILNHKAAIELLVGEGEQLALSERLLRSVHAALSENLMPTKAEEGALRRREVRIASSNYWPTAVPQLIEECFGRIVSTARQITDPFEQSFFLMVHLPYLQPFTDVNKRTSRLAANIPLIASNLCPLTFVDVPEQEYTEAILAIYELKRIELLRNTFVRAYQRSCELYLVAQQAVTQPDPIRLRYREALSAAVVDAVRGGVVPTLAWGQEWAATHHVPVADRTGFAEVLIDILLGLNDASAARYRILPSEFEQWSTKVRSP
ncbi:MAG: Fic family protein [Gemmatimonadaceae bacterium]|nr:Fic family protein [Gemmatimonadaceae bacterium]